MAKTTPFDKFSDQYEHWFTSNHFAYLSELAAIRSMMPREGKAVEIGVGSGLFAAPLKIKEGCDPSEAMRTKAIERGINAIACSAEDLPYEDSSFDLVLMVTTICFVDDAPKTIQEVNRILKPGGTLVLAFVDKDSPVGQLYQKNKSKSRFYKDASFFSTDEIKHLLTNNGFTIEKSVQTIFGNPSEMKEIQKPLEGDGRGSFIVVLARNVIESSTKCMVDHYLYREE
ncbi:MAG: class I SAM-dependent methyltransferase [Bacteroidota bacterium]